MEEVAEMLRLSVTEEQVNQQQYVGLDLQPTVVCVLKAAAAGFQSFQADLQCIAVL